MTGTAKSFIDQHRHRSSSSSSMTTRVTWPEDGGDFLVTMGCGHAMGNPDSTCLCTRKGCLFSACSERCVIAHCTRQHPSKGLSADQPLANCPRCRMYRKDTILWPCQHCAMCFVCSCFEEVRSGRICIVCKKEYTEMIHLG